jgi:hypothetical protein
MRKSGSKERRRRRRKKEKRLFFVWFDFRGLRLSLGYVVELRKGYRKASTINTKQRK